jgi:hypothetical protein
MIRRFIDDFKEYKYLDDMWRGGKPRMVIVLLAVWAWAAVTHGVAVLICKVFGHKLISTDHGDEESGYMGVECTRCGYSAGQRLY